MHADGVGITEAAQNKKSARALCNAYLAVSPSKPSATALSPPGVAAAGNAVLPV